MTDSTTHNRNETRERLITGARDMIHANGVAATALADIADASGVPVGNIYYHFKTKGDLVDAVVGRYSSEISNSFESLAQLDGPVERLHALVDSWAELAPTVSVHGCPHGSLCQELNKTSDADAPNAASTLLTQPLDWIRRQFLELRRDDAAQLAVALLGSLQGVSLLANTLSDPDLMYDEALRLKKWIAAIADNKPHTDRP